MSVGIIAFTGCGGGTEVADPDTGEFDLDPSVQMDIDDAANSGSGAEGTYDYDADTGTLTITITASTFACGVETDEPLVAIVTELTATTMVWAFPDDQDAGVTWTRVDNGDAGIVGVWETDEPHLYLIISSDGTAQIFGDDLDCNEDQPRNDEGCFEMGLFGATITLDGSFDDWDAVGESATLYDPMGDQTGSDPGTDLARLEVELDQQYVYVLTTMHAALTTDETVRYRLTVKGDAGLSMSASVYYDAGAQDYTLTGFSPEVDARVGDGGIEWAIDISAFVDSSNPFESIDMIMIEPMDCSGATCETIDYMDCAWFATPFN